MKRQEGSRACESSMNMLKCAPKKPWFHHSPVTTAQEQYQVTEAITKMDIMADSPKNKT